MSLDNEVDALRKVPLFRGIEAGKLRLLAFISDRTQFPSGEHLFEQGDQGDSAYIVLDGSADVLVATEHGDRVVATIGAHDIVGEIAILCDVPRTATLVAQTDLDTLMVSKENFLKLLEEFPEMALEVMRVLAQRLERTTRDLAAAKANTTSQAAG